MGKRAFLRALSEGPTPRRSDRSLATREKDERSMRRQTQDLVHLESTIIGWRRRTASADDHAGEEWILGVMGAVRCDVHGSILHQRRTKSFLRCDRPDEGNRGRENRS